MSFESEYQVAEVAASRIASENIDSTFRSSSIGKSYHITILLFQENPLIPVLHRSVALYESATCSVLCC